MSNEIDYKLMKKKIEEARKLSLKLGLTKTNEDGKLLFQMITGLEPTKENWKNGKNTRYII